MQICTTSGIIIGGDGRPVAGATVTASRVRVDNTRQTTYEVQVTSDSSGVLSFSFPQGAKVRLTSSDVSPLNNFNFNVPNTVTQNLGNFKADLASEVGARELAGVGSVPAATAALGLTVKEYGNEAMRKTVFTFNNFSMNVANTTGASFGNKQLYDFPQGRLMIVGGSSDLDFNWHDSNIDDAGSGDFSLGTTGTSDATLNSTDVDIMASTALTDPFVSGVGVANGNVVKTTEFDGTATAKDLYLNIIVDDADVSDAATDAIVINGTLTIIWALEGDY